MADGDGCCEKLPTPDTNSPKSNGMGLLESITFREDELPSPDDVLTPGAQDVVHQRTDNRKLTQPMLAADEHALVDNSNQQNQHHLASRGPTPSPKLSQKGVGGKLWDETFGRNSLTTQSSPWSSKIESHLSMDEASFNLFTQSFDTLSEAGEYHLQKHQHQLQQQQPDRSIHLNETPIKINEKGPSKLDRSTFQLDLPTLMPADSEISVGNMSPIKVDLDQEADAATVFVVEPPSVKIPRGGGGGGGSVGGDFLLQHSTSSLAWQDITQFDQADHYVDERISTAALVDNHQQLSNPFYVLRMSRTALSGCTFLLDCLQQVDLCTVNLHMHGSFHLYRKSKELTHRDELIIAARRVEAAICAFGGTINLNDSERVPQAIFRPKVDAPNSSLSLSGVQNTAFEESFHKQYTVMAGKITWEVEQDPPLRTCDKSSVTSLNRKRAPSEMIERDQSVRELNASKDRRFQEDQDDETYSGNTPSPNTSVTEIDVRKMKYRCKLCGKPKQNHDCPNLQSLQRSIGIMVYPAVNSFTAHEPGVLTPALSQMNNFVFYDSDHSPEPSYEQPSHGTAPRRSAPRHPSVTPETPRTGVVIQSLQSSFSTPSRGHSPRSARRQIGTAGTHAQKTSDSRARSQSTFSGNSGSVGESLFVEAVTLRPEHYRAVTPPKPTTTNSSSYSYPAIPLSYAERKRLSDTLFCLSREIPTVTENCAALLRTAREKNEWDTAVAELLTQVVIGLYCGEGDSRLDGLHHYLLKLGVAC